MGKVKIYASVERVLDIGKRDATFLENETNRILIDDQGGIVPELSARSGNGWLNAHWQALFRVNSGEKYSEKKHAGFWGNAMMYNAAGNFFCSPNFCAGPEINGVKVPPHGWTPNLKWKYKKSGVDEETGAAWTFSTMKSPDSRVPLLYEKTDMIIPGHPVHYTSLTVKNSGNEDIEINAAFHNNVGAPFLQAGSIYSASAEKWGTIPKGQEYDTSTRLALGKEFDSLKKAPLKKGGAVDISLIPPPIGYTDYVAGAIPKTCKVGWSAMVNPIIKYVYICFFPGPALATEDDITLWFNAMWMQYGGRPFPPYAPYEGGTDVSYCVGTENVTAAYGGGLEYSKKMKKALGVPTTINVKGKSRKTLNYATLFAPYSRNTFDNSLCDGIQSLAFEDNKIVALGAGRKFCILNADSSFSVLKKIAGQLNE
jgi:hypothetical protein